MSKRVTAAGLIVAISLSACTAPRRLASADDSIRDPQVDYVASPFGNGPFLVRGATVEYKPTHIEMHRGWLLLKWLDAKSGRLVSSVWMPVSAVAAIEEIREK